jgi:site-specific DNA recombinase
MFHEQGVLVIGATYARVSTIKQAKDGVSIDEQERKMLEYAERADIRVPEEYRFSETVSGLKDEREEYAKIQELIRQGKIQALIVYSSDRHTRDPIHGKIFRSQLRRSKAHLHIVMEGGATDIYSAQGELLSTIKDAFNNYWLQKILEVTYEKKQEYLRKGIPFVQGTVRFGYRREGKKLDARAVVHEEEAEVVRRIFAWAEEGLSVTTINRLLSGTPSPGDVRKRKDKLRDYGTWGPMAVYRVLRDEIYAGVYWANRVEVYDDEHGTKRRRVRPREEWVAIDVPPIVTREQWDRVQDILNRGRRERPRMHSKYDYLLARRITCGTCGYAATSCPHPDGKGGHRFYYACTTHFANGALAAPRCRSRKFRVADTDAAVWRKFKELVTSPQVFVARLRQDQARQQEVTAEDQGQLAELDELIYQHTAELNVLLREYRKVASQGSTLANLMRQQMTELEAMIDALEQRRERMARKLAQKAISDEEIASVEELAAWAAPRLAVADNEFIWRRRLIEAFNWRFTLVERDEQRIVVIHWRGLDFEVEVNYPPRRRRR